MRPALNIILNDFWKETGVHRGAHEKVRPIGKLWCERSIAPGASEGIPAPYASNAQNNAEHVAEKTR